MILVGGSEARAGKSPTAEHRKVDLHTIAHFQSPALYVWRHGPMGLRSLLVAPCVCGGLRYANLTRLPLTRGSAVDRHRYRYRLWIGWSATRPNLVAKCPLQGSSDFSG